MKFTTKPTGIWATYDQMTDYYEAGANGLPPKHPLDDRK